jgi:uncharacterized protein
MLAGIVLAAVLAGGAPALAAPDFPALTGRVVDEAGILSPAVEADLTGKLEALEAQSGRQLVVVTLKDLRGEEIETYGVDLGRHWAIGDKTRNDGTLFIVAPNDRKVRIEVGYGAEGVLTDAMSGLILRGAVLPKFRDGDMEGGVVAGTDAIIRQLTLPEDEARALAAQAAEESEEDFPLAAIPFLIFGFIVLMIALSGRRRRRRGLAGALPWVIGSTMGGWSGGGGGGGWSGGGGFSGGGGSFGGGGASGGW